MRRRCRTGRPTAKEAPCRSRCFIRGFRRRRNRSQVAKDERLQLSGKRSVLAQSIIQAGHGETVAECQREHRRGVLAAPEPSPSVNPNQQRPHTFDPR